MNRDECRNVMAAATVLWPHSPIYPAGQASLSVDVWHRILGDLDPEIVDAALVSLSSEGRDHAPAVGVIRKRALELRGALGAPGGVPSAVAAWDEVRTQIGRVGRYGAPTWSHPAIAATVRSFGWRHLCDSTNLDVLQAAFRRAYDTHATSDRIMADMPTDVRRAITAASAALAIDPKEDDDEHAEVIPLRRT